jgi:hypothetical protein
MIGLRPQGNVSQVPDDADTLLRALPYCQPAAGLVAAEAVEADTLMTLQQLPAAG